MVSEGDMHFKHIQEGVFQTQKYILNYEKKNSKWCFRKSFLDIEIYF